MRHKFYVGNLASSCTPDDLSGLFSRFGTVSGALVSRKYPGSGFVDVDTDVGEGSVIRALDRKASIRGRTLFVRSRGTPLSLLAKIDHR
jgi:RNA recognition motif-containing protein